MPGLMRLFFSSTAMEIVVFELTQGPEDEATAQQASDYISLKSYAN